MKKTFISTSVIVFSLFFSNGLLAKAQTIEEKIKEKDDKIEAIVKNKESAENYLTDLDNKITQLEKEYKKVLVEKNTSEKKLTEINQKITALEERIRLRNKLIEEQARNAQVNQKSDSIISVMVNAESLSDAVTAAIGMTKLISASNEIMQAQIDDKENLDELKKEAEKKVTDAEKETRSLEEKENDLIEAKLTQSIKINEISASLATEQSEKAKFENQKQEAEKRREEELKAIAEEKRKEAEAAAILKAQEAEAASIIFENQKQEAEKRREKELKAIAEEKRKEAEAAAILKAQEAEAASIIFENQKQEAEKRREKELKAIAEEKRKEAEAAAILKAQEAEAAYIIKDQEKDVSQLADTNDIGIGQENTDTQKEEQIPDETSEQDSNSVNQNEYQDNNSSSDNTQIQSPSSSGWGAPVANIIVTSPFGGRADPTGFSGSFHNGIDMGGTSSTPIMASRSGTVVQASFDGSAGNYIIIDHGDGYYSYYLHLSNYIATPGQSVSAGQTIGTMGTTGNSTGVHLHFGIATSSNWSGFVDPAPFLGI
ncbi:peptidoglycan DD-metalloendopeptidase family protein [Enterococcus durans]|uniref:peptidoglycan DD-metalloendopeptidase family protein n=1 Tax=Enterococcus durans TaxID=53345 RepID=UPI00136A4D3E|nr:peptidoglycan DD-metalloendopeptidase family protein [Enterococcus durans]MZH25803.1 peptidoglycan DD-metalloendopeptidase family protein [Enterococcus durans]MZI12410.1 peptidoglycan DD-metalloendopeptidase family protein [Enterococcus durans]MZI16956.1 peptidoglycan DD-metalloendopeptidase family protein [Enterococcus durans]MZI38008.1 peptidoglycan DD-metalloendopeptidase family protein [Enterococcus durans]MZI46338.1 peptidoglycan DD-metalloendopeptidase family protein [Enterococcus dur